MGNQTGRYTEFNNGGKETNKLRRRNESIKLRKEIQSIKHRHIEHAIKEDQKEEPKIVRNANGKRSLSRKRATFIPKIPSLRRKSQFVDPTKYDYPFENLVFEGGGSKGLSYLGVVQVLIKCGIMKQIKRFSGTSIGSLYAASLAMAMPEEEIKRIMSFDMHAIIYDARCGCCSLLPNLIRKFGWNPGNKFYEWYGEVLKENTGDADITFMDVYRIYGNELCVVLTNISHMEEFYCHPKTTPDMPIRLAVRMSISIPGIFQAKSIESYGEQIVCVDGGILCNYPIHCFDGWWLSLKRGDSFIERLQPLDAIPYLLSKTERFGTYNDKTLGIKCYSDYEVDMWRTVLDAKIGEPKPEEYPDTRLARKARILEGGKRLYKEHEHIVDAVDRFLKALKDTEIEDNENISEREFYTIFEKEMLSKEDTDRLFGAGITPEMAFKALDLNGDRKISSFELMLFIQQSGISIQNRFLRFQKTYITGLRSYVEAIYGALSQNMYRIFVEDNDIKRTIGINTGYIDALKFNLKDEDKEFLMLRGKHATTEYLKDFVISNELTRRPSQETIEETA